MPNDNGLLSYTFLIGWLYKVIHLIIACHIAVYISPLFGLAYFAFAWQMECVDGNR